MALKKYGIQPQDALKIIEYNEVDYFLEQCREADRTEKILRRMELAETFRMAHYSTTSKTGALKYQQWYNNLRDDLKPRKKEKSRSLFEKLKGSEVKKNQNIFQKLKRGR